MKVLGIDVLGRVQMTTPKPPKVTKSNLRDLIMHMYIHARYRDCGYDKMTREQRDLYLYVIGDS